MFTWIIEKKAKILDVDNGRFTVENHFWSNLVIGQSIAHDWACMTIESFDDDKYTFFAMQESLKRTNFWTKNTWDFFNIERCLEVWARLDGHFVSGHIDAISKVLDLKDIWDWSVEIFFEIPSGFRKNLIEKGSITINWTSLTLCHLDDNSFSVSLIPLTQEITNLGLLKAWSIVNLEFDMLGKYILNLKNLDNV